MRVTREQAAANREAIVTAAAAMFRQYGFDGVGLDDIMGQAGLTHGGFYRHFASKEDLAAEAVSHGLAASAQRQAGLKSLEAFLKSYLSSAHRENVQGGCVLAALGGDIARGGDGPRRVLTEALQAQISRLAGWVGGRGEAARRRRAVSTLAAMVGALVLARAVDDTALSEEILSVTRAACAKAALAA